MANEYCNAFSDGEKQLVEEKYVGELSKAERYAAAAPLNRRRMKKRGRADVLAVVREVEKKMKWK